MKYKHDRLILIDTVCRLHCALCASNTLAATTTCISTNIYVHTHYSLFSQWIT